MEILEKTFNLVSNPGTTDKNEIEMSFFNRSGWQTFKRPAEPSVSKDVRKQTQFMHCWWE